MNNKSLIKNYIYNVGLTVLNIIFPLITFPYASRIIGANGIGKVAFANSIVNYFLICAGLGISVYAVREIAKVRNNRINASRIFSEIFIINFISTLIFSIVYYLSLDLFNLFGKEKLLFNVIGILLILNFINIDWLYQGFEKYKYITIRSFIFKLISFILLFIMIKTKGDYVKYALLSIIAQSGSNIINIINSRELVSITFKKLNLKRHLKSIFIIFFMGLAINIYNNLDSTILGLKVGAIYVGYYTAAVKINRLVISVINSLGIVLLPRLSYYIEKNRKKEFDVLIYRSINYILFICIPSCVGLYFLSPSIIRIFSGKEFIPSITAMRINIPVIFFVAVANITSLQILLPLKKEKQIMCTNIVGAVINLILNMIFIPIFKHNGAAMSSCISEFTVTVLQLYFCTPYLKNTIHKLNSLNYILGSIIVAIELIIIVNIKVNDFAVIVISIFVSIFTYFLFLKIRKDNMILFIEGFLKSKKIYGGK